MPEAPATSIATAAACALRGPLTFQTAFSFMQRIDMRRPRLLSATLVGVHAHLAASSVPNPIGPLTL